MLRTDKKTTIPPKAMIGQRCRITVSVFLTCVLASSAQRSVKHQHAHIHTSDLLRQVAAAYWAITDYVIAVRVTNYGNGFMMHQNDIAGFSGQNIHPTFSLSPSSKIILARSGSAFRFQISNYPFPRHPFLWITSGQTTWCYHPVSNQYTVNPAAPWPKRARPGPDLAGLEWEYFAKFHALAGMAAQTRLVNDHVKHNAACPGTSTEVKLSMKSPYGPVKQYLYILHKSNLVCKSVVLRRRPAVGRVSNWTITTTWDYKQLSGPIDPALFEFKPPKGAHRVVAFKHRQ